MIETGGADAAIIGGVGSEAARLAVDAGGGGRAGGVEEYAIVVEVGNIQIAATIERDAARIAEASGADTAIIGGIRDEAASLAVDRESGGGDARAIGVMRRDDCGDGTSYGQYKQDTEDMLPTACVGIEIILLVPHVTFSISLYQKLYY